jgi:O-antigen/teichoic acid export membrane protein
MVGEEAVGIYSAALRISQAWYFVPMVIVASVFPSILEAKKHSNEKYLLRFQNLYDLMTFISVAISLLITFLADPIIRILFGNSYAEASAVLSIHIWTSIFVFLGVASGRWFIAENLQILNLQRAVLGAAINVCLNVLLIPNYGAIGAAIATMISFSISGLFFDLIQRGTREMFFMKIRSFNIFRSCRIIFGAIRH